MDRIKRKVVLVENYMNPHARGTQGSNDLTLECGHHARRKGSIKIPKTVLCYECGADYTNGADADYRNDMAGGE